MRLIREKLVGMDCAIKIEKHNIVENTEYLRLTIACENKFMIHIREYVKANRIIRYSYQLLINSEDVLRYDNAPHHPEIRTHPHHKHKKTKTYPLHNPSLKAFLEEVLGTITSVDPP